MARIGTVRVIDQRRNLCLAVVASGKIVERYFYGKRHPYFRDGDCPLTHGYGDQLMSAQAFAIGWAGESLRLKQLMAQWDSEKARSGSEAR